MLWLIADAPGKSLTALRAAAELDSSKLSTSLRWLEALGYIQRRQKRFYVASRFLALWLLRLREELQEAEGESAEEAIPVSSESCMQTA